MKECWCGCQELLPFSPYYKKCRRCGTLVSIIAENIDEQVEVSKAENDALYGANYWKKNMVNMAGGETLEDLVQLYLKGRVSYWLSTVLRYKLPPARCCEIGCGLGQFSYLLQKAEYDVTAMEVNEEICHWIQKHLYIPVKQGVFQEYEGMLDVFIANDVLEHIANPHALMQQIYARLNPEGIVILQTPCFDGQSSYEELCDRNARFLEQMKEKEHVYLYTKKSICELLAQYGFQCVFENAYFGNDYDMYIVAGKTMPKAHSPDIVQKYLNSIENGPLLLALITQSKDTKLLQDQLVKCNEQLMKMDEDIRYLNQAAKERLEGMERLKKQLSEMNAQIDEIEARRKCTIQLADDSLRAILTILDTEQEKAVEFRTLFTWLSQSSSENAEYQMDVRRQKELKRILLSYWDLLSLLRKETEEQMK